MWNQPKSALRFYMSWMIENGLQRGRSHMNPCDKASYVPASTKTVCSNYSRTFPNHH
jgi:hypothetical protein